MVYPVLKTNTLISCVFLFILLSLLSCREKHENRSSAFSVKDDLGNEVSLDEPPQRIISLAPNITETLFSIGADSRIVGVTSLCDYPPQAKLKPRTGSYISPDYEAISALKPDLIMLNVETSSNPLYQSLKNMGMKLFVSKAKNYEDILKMIETFAIITGNKSRGDSLKNILRNERESLLSSSGNRIDTALILISINPLMTTNGETFINDILKFANVMNIYRDQPIQYPEISYEDVISRDPKKIIFPTDTNDAERSEKLVYEIKRQLKLTSAVKNNKIILVDENVMYRPGPRIMEAAFNLRSKLSQAK